jgi:F-box and WD-40 domain protein CDC4
MENRRPRSSQTVTVSLGEETLPDAASSAPANSTARPLQYELSECVETKTVTTTTTTKRTFPTLFVREPRPIESLDARDYPLALAPIPAELLTVSFDVPRGDTSGHGQRVQERSKALVCFCCPMTSQDDLTHILTPTVSDRYKRVRCQLARRGKPQPPQAQL